MKLFSTNCSWSEKISNIMMLTLISYCTLCFSPTIYAIDSEPSQENNQQKWARIRLVIPQGMSLPDLEAVGLDMEHASGKHNSIETVCSFYLLDILRKKNISFEVLDSNYEQTLENRIIQFDYLSSFSTITTPTLPAIGVSPRFFSLGSWAGYYTLSEIYAQMDSLRLHYPSLISEADTIGYTFEKRPLLAWKVTNKVLSNNKLGVFYSALHHAREPGSATAILYFLYDICQRFEENNAEAQFLLNTKVLHVVPCLNPDGYEFNRQQRPLGGGLWRKNRSKTFVSAIGTDLNRNYGPLEFWNSPNQGSATDPSLDTYRGTAPFSENETKAIRDYFNKNIIKTALNYHTYGNLLVYPFSYTENESHDSLFFRHFASTISTKNKFCVGRDLETVGYATRGSSDDYLYLNGTLSMTPEAGDFSDGFWPTKDKIIPNAQKNLDLNYSIAWAAGSYIRLLNAGLGYSAKQVPSIELDIVNIGYEPSQSNEELRLRLLSSSVQLENQSDSLRILSVFSRGERRVFSIPLRRVTPAFSTYSEKIGVEISITQNGCTKIDTLWTPVADVSSTTLSDVGLWTFSKWGTEQDSKGNMCFTDSPNSPTPARYSGFMTQKELFPIPNGNSAWLFAFDVQWANDVNYDFAFLEVSTDSGKTWANLQTPIMREGNSISNSVQRAGTFGFAGNFPITIRQSCSLDEYRGKNILLRFGSQTSISGGGFEGIRVYNPEILELRSVSVGIRSSDDINESSEQFSGQLSTENNEQKGEFSILSSSLQEALTYIRSSMQELTHYTTHENYEMRVFSTLLQQVYDNQSNEVNSNLPNGLYLVVVRYKNKNVTGYQECRWKVLLTQ